MPKNSNIKRVLVIGSGPIVIGQAAEFDYSGTQACEALMEEGVEAILVNSNPATIMTDKEMAYRVYIEPINSETIEKIIEKERPDSILPGMGGQTGLNVALELYDKGILSEYDVKVIGTSIESIKKGEDRELFRKLMEEIDQPIIESKTVSTIKDALEYAQLIDYPVVVRPAYTLGGTGGGIAENPVQLVEIASKGIHLSRAKQVLVEKSIKGWKEIEYEVMRDKEGNCITVCNMENVDPVGIHTGDSIVVAPSQTLSDREYQMLRMAAFDIIDAVGIEGGCNVQFALDPNSFRYTVIEINPRVSRSSALASKAAGYPIAKVAAKIAIGYSLHEIRNTVTRKTYACFEPALDYVVVKIPKWPFDKFYSADRQLGTKMMATGEVMAIGSNFESALLKAIRSLELKLYSLDHKGVKQLTLSQLREKVLYPNDERVFYLAEMIRRGYRVQKLSKDTGIDEFYLYKIKSVVDEEEKLKRIKPEDLTKEYLLFLKSKGFSDKGIADLMGVSPNYVYELRKMWEINTAYNMVDTCAGEFEAVSPYYYSSYGNEDEVEVTQRKKVVVIGSGPIRIGQGIEFDYCSVHCVKSLKSLGIETIIVNNNPETVSTDFDVADKLYFEPLTEEDAYSIIEKERPDGVILQFGGQTAIKLAKFFEDMNVKVLGTSPKDVDTAEDREKFDCLLEQLGIKRPEGKAVWTIDDGLDTASKLGYPILVRPSYVLGGQGMEICYDKSELIYYLKNAFSKDKNNPVLVDKYLQGREIEVDALSDGEDVLIPGIMEHLERAGVHSGDSISIYPPQNISNEVKDKVLNYTRLIAAKLNIVGMINIQFIDFQGELYVIEVNPRASRTVPYMSKVTGIPIVKVATLLMLGEKLADLPYGVGLHEETEMICAKVPVFSTEKLPNVEAGLGPEMRSTGEVLGVDRDMMVALFKGLTAAGMDLCKRKRRVLVTLRDKDKRDFKELAIKMKELGYDFVATKNTAEYLRSIGVKAEVVNKIHEGSPNILDAIRTGNIDMVFNTPTKGNDSKRDGFTIRRTAVESSVELITSLDKAKVIVDILYRNISSQPIEVIPSKDYHDVGKC